MSILGSDVRYAARMLWRRPMFSIAAVAVLSLGLGVNVALFSIIDAVLLKPLPYLQPDRLVTLRQIDRAQEVTEASLIAPATFLNWREATTSFDAVSAVRPWSFTDASTGEPEVFSAGLVSQGFFELLGVQPALGRLPTREDYQQGAPVVAVISDPLWRSRFGSDPGIIGRTMAFDRGPVTIVGVLPPQFYWLDHDQVMWAPYVITESAYSQRRQTYLRAVARLKAGASVDGAAAEAAVLVNRLADEHPDVYRTVTLQVTSIEDDITSDVRSALVFLVGAVGLILAVACANVAGLMLARSAERQREFSVRVALGAGTGRLARHLVVEALLLALGGSALGLVFAYWSIGTIVAMTPGEVPRLDQATLDWRVVLIGMLLAGVTAVVIGLGPVLHARRDVMLALRATRTTGRRRPVGIRYGFVASEIAVTFVLLIGAGLLVRSFAHLTNIDPGFRPNNVVMLETLVWSTYPEPDQQRLFFAEALTRVRAIPGVLASGGVTALPFLGKDSIEMEAAVRVVGRTEQPASASAWLSIATPGYFEAMGIPLLDGRAFGDEDQHASTAVAVVSEGFARTRLGPTPIGQSIVVSNSRTLVPLQVIGVVRDVRHGGFDAPTRHEVFVPLNQVPFGTLSIVVRTTNDPLSAVPFIRAAIRSVNPTQTFGTVASVDQLVGITLAPRRFFLALAIALAAVAFVLAMIGLYGTVALLAAQRTREIAVRIALGSTRREILGLILRTGLLAPLLGTIVGAFVALASARALEAYLVGVEATDPFTFVGVALLMLTVSLFAVYLPAQSAMRVDPVVALREE